MCGRFTLFAEPATVAAFVQAPEPTFEWEPRYNIAPTQSILACRLDPETTARELVRLRWGLVPSCAADLSAGVKAVNPRAETVAEKPFFRSAFARRRCLIPASDFYEWQKQGKAKHPYFIHPAQGPSGQGRGMERMTEAEWLDGTDPDDLLEFLRDRASDRQFRLFMCACCRRFLPLMPRTPAHDRRLCEKYVAHGEQFADGLLTWEDMAAAFTEREYAKVSNEGYLAAVAARQTTYREVVGSSRPMLRGRNLIAHPASTAAEYARTVMSRLQMNNAAAKGSTPTAKKRLATIAEKRYQIQLLHDIFGNPFRSITLNPAWLAWKGSTVRRIAQSIYDDRAFERLPVLADALEEAGCDQTDILDHYRQPRVHVRGCRVVDLLLAKE